MRVCKLLKAMNETDIAASGNHAILWFMDY